MNENPDLPSQSDSSDDDYVPGGVADVSEDESVSSVSEGEKESGNAEVHAKRKKRGSKATSKKHKTKEKENEPVEDPAVVLTGEELKKKSDDLWADFMKDVGPVGNRIKSDSNDRVMSKCDEKENSKTPETEPTKSTVTQIFEFAGEKVQVDKVVDSSQVQASNSRGRGKARGGGGGLASLLTHIGKKGKLSTLEKSKLDWERFKKDEGINEDIEQHNKGKNGYFEKQDFLQRADLRQFEIEKNMRSTKRPFNH